MKPKQKGKLAVDFLMTILLVVLMGYPVTGQPIHEWVGAGMLLLFIAHHMLNRHWFKTLGKGQYNSLRVLQTAVDVLLLADMLALMFSGIRLSRYVFTFLPGLGSAATARRLHMLASYWGLVLMGLHLGLHWGVMAALLRRRLGGRRSCCSGAPGQRRACMGFTLCGSIRSGCICRSAASFSCLISMNLRRCISWSTSA